MKFIFLTIVSVFCVTSCVNSNSKKDHSIYWQKNSAEYYALCIQAYNTAKYRVDKALISSSDKPLAIVADIDETVLNNLPYNEMLIETGKSFTQKSWSQWVNKKEATAIPGALGFFNYVENQGVEIIYLSNRRVENYEPTKANLISAGFPFDEQTIMLLEIKMEIKNQDESSFQVITLCCYLEIIFQILMNVFTRNQMNLESKGLIHFSKCLQIDIFYFQTLFMVLGRWGLRIRM